MKKIYGFIVCLSVIVCFSTNVWSAEQQKITRLVIGTGGLAGTYYPLGGAMASIWSKNVANVKVSAQATGASIENTKLMENGEIELGLTQNDLAEFAAKKMYMFEKEYKSLRAVATLFAEHVQVFVNENSDIKSLGDLKGKRVSVGSQGSGGLANAQQIFELYGMSFKDFNPFYLTVADAADRMKDGQLDAIFTTTPAPNSTFQDLCVSKNIRLVGFSDAEIKMIVTKYPFFEKNILPKETYKGQKDELSTVSILGILVAHRDLDENIVYNLTKVLWEKKDELGSIISKAKEMQADQPLRGVTIPVHPGAVRYYKEIGKLK
jgi:uncharacterized protein